MTEKDDTKALAKFPVSMPGGDIMPYMSAKRRMAIMDAVFENTGGQTRMEEWVEASDENRKIFYGWWVKGAARPVDAAEGADRAARIEELLARLDAGESAVVANGVQVIDADSAKSTEAAESDDGA